MNMQWLGLTIIGLSALALSACSGSSLIQESSEEVQPPNYKNMPSSSRMYRAQNSYDRGMYAAALEQYRIAAQWGDKFGQYNVGVMHLRGEGVDFDPVRGWAWLELAAERNYPQFVKMADKLYALMDEEQREEGRTILDEELMPKYGDDVTVERTARFMKREQRQMTGTRTGSRGMTTFLTVFTADRDDFEMFPGRTYFHDRHWDYERIIAAEQRFMTNWAQGRIDLQPMELIDDEDENESDGSSQTQD